MTLYPLPSLVPPTPLAKTRNVFSFAIHSTVEYIVPTSIAQQLETPSLRPMDTRGVPTMVTYLVVGCQRRLVVYSWRDGEVQEVKVLPLQLFKCFPIHQCFLDTRKWRYLILLAKYLSSTLVYWPWRILLLTLCSSWIQ